MNAGAAPGNEPRMTRRRFIGVTALAFVTVLSLGAGRGIAAGAEGTQPVPDATAGLTRQVVLTPAEQLSQSESFLLRMDTTRTGVRRMLESSRAQRDTVKTLCLSDKLNQIDVAVRSARERREALQAAVQRQDADRASLELNILGVLRQRSDQVMAEAQQCIGGHDPPIGGDSVIVKVDPGIPDEPYPMDPITTGTLITQGPVPVSAVK